MSAQKLLIVITGPTCSGKTNVAIQVAEALKTEIISADSRQVYKEISIGTAKPDPSDLAKIKHHFIDSHSVKEEFNASQFEKEGLKQIAAIHQHCDYCVMAGGSSFFIDAVVNGIPETPAPNEEVRKELNERLEKEGLDPLSQELKAIDSEYFESIDSQNPRRVVRALEIFKVSGKSPRDFLDHRVKRPFKSILIGLEMEREQLYGRINQRVEEMVAQGLEDEARKLFEWSPRLAKQTVGYQEWQGFLEGTAPRYEAIELIKRNTRRYAKRQMTWWRNKKNMMFFSPEDVDGIISYIRQSIASISPEIE